MAVEFKVPMPQPGNMDQVIGGELSVQVGGDRPVRRFFEREIIQRGGPLDSISFTGERGEVVYVSLQLVDAARNQVGDLCTESHVIGQSDAVVIVREVVSPPRPTPEPAPAAAEEPVGSGDQSAPVETPPEESHAEQTQADAPEHDTGAQQSPA